MNKLLLLMFLFLSIFLKSEDNEIYKYFPHIKLKSEDMLSKKYKIFNAIPNFIEGTDVFLEKTLDGILIKINKNNYEFEMKINKNQYEIKNIYLNESNKTKDSSDEEIDLDKIEFKIEEYKKEENNEIEKELIITMPIKKNIFIRSLKKIYDYFEKNFK